MSLKLNRYNSEYDFLSLQALMYLIVKLILHEVIIKRSGKQEHENNACTSSRQGSNSETD